MMDDLEGRVIMVTGATDGIGKVTAMQLAKCGANVLLIGRNKLKSRKVVEEIIKKTGSQKVDLFITDLSNTAEIRNLASEFDKRYEKLDVLINNAGALFKDRKLNNNGIEMTFALNHLNYFLLTNLLLDKLRLGSDARIVNVSSSAHYSGYINFEDINQTKSYNGRQVYANSKLANVMFTYELDRKLQNDNITTNSLHPGFIATNFGRDNGLLYKIALTLMRPMMINRNKGAETQIYLATSSELKNISGKFFIKKEERNSSDKSYNIED